MTLQQIEQQTGTLNQQDFMKYLYRLPLIAKEKYSLNIFFKDLGNEKGILNEKKDDLENKTHPEIENILAHTGILEDINLSEEELYTINRRRNELISGKTKGVEWNTVKEMLK